MGGMTAVVVASRNPKLLRGLILADPTFLSPKVQREICDSDAADQRRQVSIHRWMKWWREARIRHPARSSDTLELIARARLQTSMSAFDVLTPPNPDYMQLVSAIDVPSLLVIGDTASVVSHAVAAELQRLNPEFVNQSAKLATGSTMSQPERSAAVVKSFTLNCTVIES